MSSSEKAVWATMIVLATIGGLLLAALMLGSAADNAVERALASDAMAQSTQRVTQVCVGLFNLGACRSTQASTSTAIRQQETYRGARDDLLALACVVPLSLFLLTGLGIKVIQDGR